jgi:hypothetical protein
MRCLAAALCLIAIALPALAQEPPKPPDNPALKNLVLALQQISTAAEIYVTDSNQRLAAKDARLAQWEAYFKAYIGEPAVAAK